MLPVDPHCDRLELCVGLSVGMITEVSVALIFDRGVALDALKVATSPFVVVKGVPPSSAEKRSGLTEKGPPLLSNVVTAMENETTLDHEAFTGFYSLFSDGCKPALCLVLIGFLN